MHGNDRPGQGIATLPDRRMPPDPAIATPQSRRRTHIGAPGRRPGIHTPLEKGSLSKTDQLESVGTLDLNGNIPVAHSVP
jgi:hypothetical protein